MNMFQSLSMEQLHTCLQMAIQQLISNATDGGDTPTNAVLQQKEQEQNDPELTTMSQTVTNLSTEQMQQLLQLQQHQSALSVLNQANVSYIFLSINRNYRELSHKHDQVLKLSFVSGTGWSWTTDTQHSEYRLLAQPTRGHHYWLWFTTGHWSTHSTTVLIINGNCEHTVVTWGQQRADATLGAVASSPPSATAAAQRPSDHDHTTILNRSNSFTTYPIK